MYVYQCPGYIVDCTEFIWGINTDIAVSCAYELVCLCGIYEAFEDIFVAGTYMTITCEADIEVACALAHINAGSICPCSIRAIWVIFAMWQPYLYSDIRVEIWYTCMHRGIHIYIHMYTDTYIHTHTDLCMSGYIYTSMYTFIYACMHTYISSYKHIYRIMDVSPYIHTYINADLNAL